MDIWNDGRSGEAGCAAGNIALKHLAENAGIGFRKVVGTTFESAEELWIGRVCATDSYLSAGVANWANLSWDQHVEASAAARADNRSLRYLFVTARADPPAVHYWAVPGEEIESVMIDQRKNTRGAIYGMHITESNRSFWIRKTNVTPYHQSVPLDEGGQARLEDGFAKVRMKKRPSAQSGSVISGTEDGVRRAQSQAFQIPLSGGRIANLNIPVPIAQSDVQRLKGWFDLMSDILVVPLP